MKIKKRCVDINKEGEDGDRQPKQYCGMQKETDRRSQAQQILRGHADFLKVDGNAKMATILFVPALADAEKKKKIFGRKENNKNLQHERGFRTRRKEITAPQNRQKNAAPSGQAGDETVAMEEKAEHRLSIRIQKALNGFQSS